MSSANQQQEQQRSGPGRPRDAELTARRRQEILAAAASAFAKHGYAATDVQNVADQLGVGKGTIYRYFATKEALFLAAVDAGMRELGEAVQAGAELAATPLGRIEAGIRAYLTYFDEHPEVVELLIQERAQFRDRKKPTYFEHQEANIGPWKDLICALMAEGKIRTLPVERVTDVISNLLYGTMFTDYFAGRQKPVAEQCEDILDILYRGLLLEREPNAR